MSEPRGQMSEQQSMRGRPETDEAAHFYFTYIDQVSGDDPKAAIKSQLEIASQFFAGISEQKSLHRYAPEKWSIRQTLNHVTDTERAFGFRALWFARGFEAPLPSYDQNVAVQGAEADQVSWAEHMEEFRRVRLSTISLFANMPAEAWLRRGVASERSFSVRAVAYIISGHAAHHMAIVRDRYL